MKALKSIILLLVSCIYMVSIYKFSVVTLDFEEYPTSEITESPDPVESDYYDY